MIVCVYECGSRNPVLDNSEESRRMKREWKQAHGKENPGHHYSRRVVRRESE